MSGEQIFAIALLAGLMLIGAEVFVPGGVLGALGGIALLIAMIAAFRAFPNFGGYIAFGIIFLAGFAIVLWIKIFPQTRIGKQMTVTRDLADAKASPETLADLVGKKGVTLCDLRPAGFALIEGLRVDVVTRGEMLAKHVPVRVLEVRGNRVVVSQVQTETQTQGESV